MDSHKYAENLKLIVEFLLSKPAFPLYHDYTHVGFYFYAKSPDPREAIAASGAEVQPFSQSDSFLLFKKAIADRVGIEVGIYRTVACADNPVKIAPEFANIGKAQEKVA